MAIKSADLMLKLADRQKRIGFRLQSEAYLRQAFEAEHRPENLYTLNQAFNRHYTAIDPLKQDNILIYDQNFQLIASSERGLSSNSKTVLPCQHIIDQMKTAADVPHTKTSSQLCEYNTQNYIVVTYIIWPNKQQPTIRCQPSSV